jgi:hypothetical protein
VTASRLGSVRGACLRVCDVAAGYGSGHIRLELAGCRRRSPSASRRTRGVSSADLRVGTPTAHRAGQVPARVEHRPVLDRLYRLDHRHDGTRPLYVRPWRARSGRLVVLAEIPQALRQALLEGTPAHPHFRYLHPRAKRVPLRPRLWGPPRARRTSGDGNSVASNHG